MKLTPEIIKNSIRETEEEIIRLEGTLKALHAVLNALEKPEEVKPDETKV